MWMMRCLLELGQQCDFVRPTGVMNQIKLFSAWRAGCRLCTRRACDYVRLVGVLARENASFVAAHVRERYAEAAVNGRK